MALKNNNLLPIKIGHDTWVPVSSTGKISNGYIRDLGFNPCLHQKLISFLV